MASKLPSVNRDHYTAALEAARQELAELEDQRTTIDKRISELQQGIVGLSALANESGGGKPQSMMDVLAGVGVETGLTDAVRMITSSFGFPMTPKQVRDALLHLDYNLSGYSNILASLHTIMKRLAKAGELINVVDDAGNEIGAYAWNPTVSVRRQKLSPPDVLGAIDRAIVRLADGIEPSHPVVAKAGDRITTILKNKDPQWWEHIKQSGGLVLSNPPYFVGGKKLTRKQLREVNEAVREERVEKEVAKFDPKE